jgi:signal transduction histidine kinase
VRWLSSFRVRLLVGSILWVAGMLAIAHMLSLSLMHRYPIMIRFRHDHVLIVALIVMAIGLWQVRRGLSPFGRLRERLSAVRDGRERRLEGTYPTEVQPLVNDLNAVLDHREQSVRRAVAKAGDLAHGLKTPLAVLAQEAERAESAGQREAAAAIQQQVERMRRQIDYHLAHARAAASGATPGSHCSIAVSFEGLARTLLRLHADRGVTIHGDFLAGNSVRVERGDLDEMLGNLLDNACKWAASRVTVTTSESGGAIVIDVDDDGPGLDPSMREHVLQRGVRADEAAPGSGLGLAIVRDLAELYGGSIALDTAPAGGLRARLVLPK